MSITIVIYCIRLKIEKHETWKSLQFLISLWKQEKKQLSHTNPAKHCYFSLWILPPSQRHNNPLTTIYIKRAVSRKQNTNKNTNKHTLSGTHTQWNVCEVVTTTPNAFFHCSLTHSRSLSLSIAFRMISFLGCFSLTLFALFDAHCTHITQKLLCRFFSCLFHSAALGA